MTSAQLQYYPSSPQNLPKNLTKLPSSYMTKAALAVLAIILFFVLYVILVAILGYLCYLAFTYPLVDINRLTIIMKLGAILGSVMLLTFTLKFAFKLKNHKPINRIKLDKNKQSTLWKFVDKVCDETNAPKPKNIYIDPDVNAYVNYTNSWLSLFFPVKKELTIGLGLVCCTNLSEFKAVVAHEFGHFAQSSMKIGSYIMTANTIIHDMIYNRDKWDDTLDKWRSTDIRLSAAAWIITPIIWLIRQVLALFYQFLNIMYSSLSKEMEFNADKVAVSTTGSEAIISALWKLESGSEHWNKTLTNAYNASQKKLYVKNLYAHNLAALNNNKENLIEEYESLPIDVSGSKKFFADTTISKANMYASHPPNDLREKSAKTPFIKCELDTRSPWILFDEDEQLQESATRLVYDQYFKIKPNNTISFDEFETFVTNESQGEEIFADYHNTFDLRFFIVPDESELSKVPDTNHELQTITSLKDNLIPKMEKLKQLQDVLSETVNVANGMQKTFEYDGKKYNNKNIEELYTSKSKEFNSLLNEGFLDWDREFCLSLIQASSKSNRNAELIPMLNQHRTITNVYKSIVDAKNSLFTELDYLQNKPDLLERELNMFGIHMTSTVLEFNNLLDTLNDITFVPMPNIDNVQELKEAIVIDGKFIKEKGPIFENGNINKVINNLNETVNNCQRVERKSMSQILQLAKELETE